MADDECFDVVIVGAGIYGIRAATTYLELYPRANLRILEADSCVGGIWSKNRLYPGFVTQMGVRSAGFPDRPLTLPADAPTYLEFFESKHVAQYLEDYTTNHVYEGRTVLDRIMFNCQVDHVSKQNDIWTLQTKHDGQPVTYRARNLMIATGVYNAPTMPALKGHDKFRGLVVHQKDIGTRFNLTDPATTHITVLGGGKSAGDMAYESAKAGKRVSWVIRKDGGGPAVFTSPEVKGKCNNAAEQGSLRMNGYITPSIFTQQNWVTWLLHATWIGEWLLSSIFSVIQKSFRNRANYHGRPDALPGFEQLETSSELRWMSGPSGLLNRPDFWDVIAKNVHVHRAEVESLSEKTVKFTNGEELDCDVLLCCTGWSIDVPFLPLEQKKRLGLPHELVQADEKDLAHWQELDAEEDVAVLKRFPNLQKAPRFRKPWVTRTPYRLHRGIAPLDDRSIVFLGHVTSLNAFLTSPAQTLWACAYLNGGIALPARGVMGGGIASFVAWDKRQYPTQGQLGHFIAFDSIAYIDALLDDLGVSSHKTGHWWTDLTSSNRVSAFGGIVDEYRSRRA